MNTEFTTPIDVITLGESMALLVADRPGPLAEVGHFSKCLSGAETNVAIGLARLGFRVSWVSRLGDDSFGKFILSSVKQEGVDCTKVTVDPQRSTGFMLKSRTSHGIDPVVEYFRRHSAASILSLKNFDENHFNKARHLHVTGITPALSPDAAKLVEHSMRFMREAGCTVSFDPNLRPSLWSSSDIMVKQLNKLAAMAHWVLPGVSEGRVLTGHNEPIDIANFYLNLGVEAVIVKLGAEGAYYKTIGEEGVIPGIDVPKVIDTVGAGDGFAVGVISAKLESLTWPAALARGNWIGAQVIQTLGDMDGLPSRSRLLSET